MEEKPKQVTFEYKISPNYTVYAISGIHGGLNAQGQIVINLFHERSAIPKTETCELDEKGQLVLPPSFQDVKASVIRDVLLGISISPTTARATAKWLTEKADQFEQLFQMKGK